MYLATVNTAFLCFLLLVFSFSVLSNFFHPDSCCRNAWLLETSRQRALSAIRTIKRNTMFQLIRDQVACHACTWFNICHLKPNAPCDHGPCLPCYLSGFRKSDCITGSFSAAQLLLKLVRILVVKLRLKLMYLYGSSTALGRREMRAIAYSRW